MCKQFGPVLLADVVKTRKFLQTLDYVVEEKHCDTLIFLLQNSPWTYPKLNQIIDSDDELSKEIGKERIK